MRQSDDAIGCGERSGNDLRGDGSAGAIEGTERVGRQVPRLTVAHVI